MVVLDVLRSFLPQDDKINRNYVQETKTNLRIYMLLGAGVILVMTIVLYVMGRVPICECGYVKLWHGIVVSSENSQHLFDWYTFTHVSHGIIIYFLISVFGKKLSLGKKLLLAILLECSWEVLENTDMVINRYRAATISLDYFGDSVVNSVGDVIAMIAGFWFAAKQRVWQSLGLLICLEIALAIIIRDNLTLNILMLIYPIDKIKIWQSGLM